MTAELNPPIFSRWTWHRAKREHACFECLLTIERGERYSMLSGKWAGIGFQTFRYCESCELWARLALYALKLHEYPIGALDEAIAEKSRVANGSYYVNPFRV